MIQLIVLGFFVCLGAKAGMDLYDSGKRLLTHEGVDALKKGVKAAKEGAHKVHETVDSKLGIHEKEHGKEVNEAKA